MSEFDFNFISNNDLPVSSYKDIKAFSELISPTKKETNTKKAIYEKPLTYRTEDWSIYQLMVNQNIDLTRRNLEIAKALHRYKQIINQLNVEYMAQWLEALKYNSEVATEAVTLLVSRNLEVSQENFDSIQQLMQDQNIVIELKELSKKIDNLNDYIDKVIKDKDIEVKRTNDNYSEKRIEKNKNIADKILDSKFIEKETDNKSIEKKIIDKNLQEEHFLDKENISKSKEYNNIKSIIDTDESKNTNLINNELKKIIIENKENKYNLSNKLSNSKNNIKIIENEKKESLSILKNLKTSDFTTKSIVINDEPVIITETSKVPSFQKIIKLNKLPSEAKLIQNEPVIVFSNGRPQLAIKDTSGLKILLVNTSVIEKKLGIIKPETFRIKEINNKIELSFENKTNIGITTIKSDYNSVKILSTKPEIITFNGTISLITPKIGNLEASIIPLVDNYLDKNIKDSNSESTTNNYFKIDNSYIIPEIIPDKYNIPIKKPIIFEDKNELKLLLKDNTNVNSFKIDLSIENDLNRLIESQTSNDNNIDTIYTKLNNSNMEKIDIDLSIPHKIKINNQEAILVKDNKSNEIKIVPTELFKDKIYTNIIYKELSKSKNYIKYDNNQIPVISQNILTKYNLVITNNTIKKDKKENLKELKQDYSTNLESKINSIDFINEVLSGIPDKNKLEKITLNNYPKEILEEINKLEENIDIDKPILLRDSDNNLVLAVKKDKNFFPEQIKSKKESFSNTVDIKSEVEDAFNKIEFNIPEKISKINNSNIVKIILNNKIESNIKENLIFEIPFQLKNDQNSFQLNNIETNINLSESEVNHGNNENLENIQKQFNNTFDINKPKIFIVKNENKVFGTIIDNNIKDLNILKTNEGKVIFKDNNTNKFRVINISNKNFTTIEKENLFFDLNDDLFMLNQSKEAKTSISKFSFSKITPEIIAQKSIETDNGEIIFIRSNKDLNKLNLYSFYPKQLQALSIKDLFKKNNFYFDESYNKLLIKNESGISIKSLNNNISDYLININNENNFIQKTDQENIFVFKNDDNNEIKIFDTENIPSYLKETSEKNFIFESKNGDKILFFQDKKDNILNNILINEENLNLFEEQITPIKTNILGKEKIIFKDNSDFKMVNLDKLTKESFRSIKEEIIYSEHKPILVLNSNNKSQLIDIKKQLENATKIENKIKVSIDGNNFIIIPDNTSGNHNIFPEKPSNKNIKTFNFTEPIKINIEGEYFYLIKDSDNSLKLIPESILKNLNNKVDKNILLAKDNLNNSVLIININNTIYKIPLEDKYLKKLENISKPLEVIDNNENKLLLTINNKLFSFKNSNKVKNILNNPISGEINKKEVFILNSENKNIVINKDSLYKYSSTLKFGSEININNESLIAIKDNNNSFKFIPKKTLFNNLEETDETSIFNINDKNIIAFKDTNNQSKTLKIMQFSNMEKQLKNINEPIVIKNNNQMGMVKVDKNNLIFKPILANEIENQIELNEPIVINQKNSYKLVFEDKSKVKVIDIPIEETQDFNNPILDNENNLITVIDGKLRKTDIIDKNLNLNNPIEIKVNNKNYLLFSNVIDKEAKNNSISNIESEISIQENKSLKEEPVSFNSEVELQEQENLVGNSDTELQGILKKNKSNTNTVLQIISIDDLIKNPEILSLSKNDISHELQSMNIEKPKYLNIDTLNKEIENILINEHQPIINNAFLKNESLSFNSEAELQGILKTNKNDLKMTEKIERILSNLLKENEPKLIKIDDNIFVINKTSDNKVNFTNINEIKTNNLEPKIFYFDSEISKESLDISKKHEITNSNTNEQFIFVSDFNGGNLLKINQDQIEVFNNPIDIKNENKLLISDNKGNLKKIDKTLINSEPIKNVKDIEIVQTLVGNKAILSNYKNTGKTNLIDLNNLKSIDITDSEDEVFFIDKESNKIKGLTKNTPSTKQLKDVINMNKKTSILNSNEGIKVLIREGNIIPFKIEDDDISNNQNRFIKDDKENIIFDDKNNKKIKLISNIKNTNFEYINQEILFISPEQKDFFNENIATKTFNKKIILKSDNENKKTYFSNIDNIETFKEPIIFSKENKNYLLINNNNKLKAIDIESTKNNSDKNLFLVQKDSDEIIIISNKINNDSKRQNISINTSNISNIKIIDKKSKITIDNEKFIIFPDINGEHKIFPETPNSNKELDLNNNPIKVIINNQKGIIFKSITNEIKFIPEDELNLNYEVFDEPIFSNSYKNKSILFEDSKGNIKNISLDKNISNFQSIEKPLEINHKGKNLLLVPENNSILKIDLNNLDLKELSKKNIISGTLNNENVLITKDNTNNSIIININSLEKNTNILEEGHEISIDQKPFILVESKNKASFLSNENIKKLEVEEPFTISSKTNNDNLIVFKDKNILKSIEYNNAIQKSVNIKENKIISNINQTNSLIINDENNPKILKLKDNDFNDFNDPIIDYSKNKIRLISNDNKILKEAYISEEVIDKSDSVNKFNHFNRLIVKPENNLPIAIKNSKKVNINNYIKITINDNKYLLLPNKDNKVLMIPLEFFNAKNGVKPNFENIKNIQVFDLENINDISNLNKIIEKEKITIDALKSELQKTNDVIKNFLSIDILKDPNKFAYNISMMKQAFGQIESDVKELKNDFESMTNENILSTENQDNEHNNIENKNKLKLKMSAESLLNAVLSEVSSRVEKINLNLHGRELLSKNENSFCIPISIPVKDYIFSGELLVKEEESNKNKKGNKTLSITLAIETKNLNKIIVEFINFNENLQISIKVDNQKVKEILTPKLPLIKDILKNSKYNITSITCSINKNKDKRNSILLPQNIFPKSLKRIEGII